MVPCPSIQVRRYQQSIRKAFNYSNSLSSTDHPNKCWLQEYSVFLIPGETYTRPGDCVEYRCESDFSYSAKTCGVVEVIDFNCGAVALDAQALYPKCCSQVVCD